MFVHELVNQGKPDAIAIIDHDRRITYKEIAAFVRNCRNRLYAAGVRQGDRVAIFSRNSAEYIYAYFGIVSLGAIAVPINFQLSSREIAYILKDAGAKHIFTYQPLDLVDAMAHLRCDMPVYQHDIRECGVLKDHVPDAPELSAQFDEDNPACIIYTSGTTGNPKGAVLSHHNLVINIRQHLSVVPCETGDHILCVLPMYHAFGWTLSVGASWRPHPRFELDLSLRHTWIEPDCQFGYNYGKKKGFEKHSDGDFTLDHLSVALTGSYVF